MKTLELNQMQELQGGKLATTVTCATAGWAIGMAVVAAVSGPVGWLAWGAMIGTGLAGGAGLGSCIYQATH